MASLAPSLPAVLPILLQKGARSPEALTAPPSLSFTGGILAYLHWSLMLSLPFLAPSPFSLTQEFLLIRILAASVPSWHLLLRGHVLHLKIPTAYIRQNLSTLPKDRGSQLLCGCMNPKKKVLKKRT